MHKKHLLRLWALLFILCAGLGFLPDPQGMTDALLKLAAVCFFIPPFLLLKEAKKTSDINTLLLVRNLCALSLVLTALLLAANFLSVRAGEWLGNLLYCMLVIVSSPMICSGIWALSLFLWAYLLVLSEKLRKSL